MSSCLFQEDCPFEIIYCDDGSENNFSKEVETFFQKHSFKDFVMKCSKENQGTLKNLIEGLKVSKYMFCKTIGAGDLFYDARSLKRVVEVFEKESSDVVITNTCYFFDDGNLKPFNVRNPIDIKGYRAKTYNQELIKKRLLLNQDLILGASVYANTDYLLNLYCEFEGKIKYTEDALLVYAALNNAKINYVDEYCIYYEYGTGISTSEKSEFQRIIQQECETIYDYMASQQIDKKYQKYLKIRKRVRNSRGIKAALTKLFLTPSQLKIKWMSKHIKKETPSFDFYKKCKEVC